MTRAELINRLNQLLIQLRYSPIGSSVYKEYQAEINEIEQKLKSPNSYIFHVPRG